VLWPKRSRNRADVTRSTIKRELREVKLETKPKTYIVGKGCSELAFAAAWSKQVVTIE
jgi:hypothetical protein